MNKSKWLACVVYAGIALLNQSALAQQANNHAHHVHHSHHRGVDAPIGIMGDHVMPKGIYMMSYRYMRMDMDGNRVGSSRVSERDIVGTMAQPGQFMVAPISMPMDMHMLGGMVGITDNITLMGMINFVSQEMDHLVRNGRMFTTESSGFGDSKISAVVKWVDQPDFKVNWSVGLSLPTGSIDERDDTPAMENAFLPYPMQLGSGTVDILPSITAIKYQGNWAFGAQLSAEIRTVDNDEGYTLGNKFNATAWVVKEFSNRLSGSLRMDYVDRDNIDGKNPNLNPMMVQTANINLQAHQRLQLGLGLSKQFNNGHRLALEYSRPIRQDVDGPQLEVDSVLTLGWQSAF